MIIKSRSEPNELVILKALRNRMNLSKTDQQNYTSLKKGFEGELLFDLLLEKLECDCFVLNDLLLKTNNQTFQIDSLIIFSNVVYLLEIKNYSGNYRYKSEKLFQKEQTEITNPLIQLYRTESLLRQLFLKLNFNFSIQSSVIFINPEFTLYQAPLDIPFIFPSQLNSFIKSVNSHQSKLNEQHKKLAEHLSSLHIEHNPYQHCPPYNYQQLRKGMPCPACFSFSITITGKKCTCTSCGNTELVESAVVRNVKEFKLLFPDEKVTTSKMYEWCKIIESRRRILRILKKNFKSIDTFRRIHFE
ncbi:nuclease-related domain-containing protein [Ureibacillus sp. GCM10028918]|uniref:nuclease-related domain-containing protein n=1 Tax=Ureibacillus sp. GCM10028918 TaxID=3273429 RepID=UPI0036F37640